MNQQLLVELDARLRRIQRVADGNEPGDVAQLFDELLDHAASVAGSDSAEYALSLRGRASHFRNIGRRDDAIAEYTRAAAMLEQCGDEVRVQTIEALLSLAAIRADRPDAADERGTPHEPFERAWVLATTHDAEPEIPVALWLTLGQMAIRRRQPERAVAARDHIRARSRAVDSRATVEVEHAALMLEASIALNTAGPADAEVALTRLLNFCRSAFGRDAEPTTSAEFSLGSFLIDQRRASEAVEMLSHAAATQSARAGAADTTSADYTFELALALDRSARDTESIDHYRRAYWGFANSVGAGNRRAVRAALNLGEVSRVAHDYDEAERWFRLALDHERLQRGPSTETCAHALNNLAESLLAAGRVDEAAPLANEALGIRTALHGSTSPEYMRSLGVVGRIAAARGDEAALDEVFDRFRAASDSDQVSLPVDLIAVYLERRGDFERAREVCEQALATLERPDATRDDNTLPDQRIELRFTLARLLTLLGRWPDAIARLHEAFKIETIRLSDEARRRSQRQMRLLLRESRRHVDTLLDLLHRAPEPRPANARAAYEVLQQRKGLETRLLILQKPSYITDRALTSAPQERLEAVREQLGRLVQALREARQASLDTLLTRVRDGIPAVGDPEVLARRDRVESLERHLASYVGVASYDWALLGITSGTPTLPAGEAIIEYFLAETPTPSYHAFVVVGDQVHLTALGDADEVDRALAQLRRHLVSDPVQPGAREPTWRRRSRFLANRLLRPIDAWLSDVHTLYVVPDGALFTLPFDLLPLDDTTSAIDRWTITHLWNGGEHAGFNVTLGSPDDPARAIVVSAPTLTTASGTADMGAPATWRFADLPFARREGEAIAAQIDGAHLDGDAATKPAVIAAGGAEIVHFATHSFWISRDAESERASESGSLLFRTRALLDDPMQRSGIALAGADAELNTPTAPSPGILFADEVLDLDLRDTDLAVLSSCQSGIGDLAPGDGIQGLRRAFRAAGANSVVSSLWKVPDEATHDLMLDFYARLLDQVPRGKALREAKLAMRARHPDDPLYWAAFVLDGLDGKLFRFSALRGLTVANLSGVGLSYDAALEHMAHERWDEALTSLDFVIHSDTATHELRADAAYQRAGILRQSGRLPEALAAYDALLADMHTPDETRRHALGDRGLTKALGGDPNGALLDYDTVLSAPDCTPQARAWTLVNRGGVLHDTGDTAGAIADYNEVMAMPDVPEELRRIAEQNLAVLGAGGQ
ncbi:MAG: CHAT domain-containing protein [Gemmatimonadaceae bacterium]|nr:CHAT domain-containing protein [Gemmatimonadaceae bacterium]